MLEPFHDILVHSLTPITLISGVGLVMLCITNRYSHCTDRIHQLIRKRSVYGLAFEPDLDDEIHLIFRRALLLRHAMLCLSSSAAFAGFLVVTNVLSTYTDNDFSTIASIFLFFSLGLIVAATIFFAMEVTLSLHALGMAVRHLPEHYPIKRN